MFAAACVRRPAPALALLGVLLAAHSARVEQRGEEEFDPLLRLPSGLPEMRADRGSADPRAPHGTCADARDDRVVSVADLHGDIVGMLSLLQRLCLVRPGVTSDPSTWTSMWVGGRATFIQLGDVNDRGDYGHIIWKFLWALQDSVLRDERTGGKVVLLLGNHESWRFTGEGPPPTDRDACTYASVFSSCLEGPNEQQACLDGGSGDAYDCYERAWSGGDSEGWPGAMFGQVLKRLEDGRMKLVHKEGSTLFVHAGWTLGTTERLKQERPLLMDSGDGDALVRELNSLAVEVLRNLRHAPLQAQDVGAFVIHGEGDGEGDVSWDGPTWTRAYEEDVVAACIEALKVLGALGGSRMVKGHDPQMDGVAKAHCGGKVLLVDTYMSVGYTHSREESNEHLMALETSTTGTGAWFVYPMRAAGPQRTNVALPPPQVLQLSENMYTCCVISVPGKVTAKTFWAKVKSPASFLDEHKAWGLGLIEDYRDALHRLRYRDSCDHGVRLAGAFGNMLAGDSVLDHLGSNADLSQGCDSSTDVLGRKVSGQRKFGSADVTCTPAIFLPLMLIMITMGVAFALGRPSST